MNTSIELLRDDMLFEDIEISDEGMLQDFLRHGVTGLIAGRILDNIERIHGKLSKYSQRPAPDSSKFGKVTARSLYLPSPSVFAKSMSKIDALGKAILTCASNANAKYDTIISELRSAGINVGNGDIADIVKNDWKAIGGSAVGMIIFGAIAASVGGPLAAPLGMYIGNHVTSTIGGHLASDKGGTLADRGWNPKNLMAAIKVMQNAIQNSFKIKNAKLNVQDTVPAENVALMKKAYRVYIYAIKNIGRGLVAACDRVFDD